MTTLQRQYDNNNNIIDCLANKNNSISFNIDQKITRQIGNDGEKDVEIMGPLNYLSNCWRAFQIP